MNTIKMQLAHDNHIDQRLQATQDSLFAVLKKDYLANQQFSTIRVGTLCQDAKVARQTYYRHYGSIGEIIEVSCVRMINQFLQKIDRTPNSTRISAQLIVEALSNHQTLLKMMFWSSEQEMVVQLITGDILRVYSFEDIHESHKPFIAELMARSVLSFAQVLIKYPQTNKADLIRIYKRMVPAPATLTKEDEK
ncbi:hypothetical protein ADU72_0178 [Pediococcus damnosus]|uniref:Transcriptional regulator n=1 Tax=Pediococcus damnosus TaxID=51663 RepID=A0A0R2HG53_9LACO|nr:hypothetical protein [Pediococcus damnosus]AMV59760.1 hypothetical protein ADU69_0080 [Pediococcus damnosus]AMV61992.1 hypothetical protein ADU70_0492 [Pediococcus damnosus]AMV64006.1 hypothetical protein ADU71_0081 [Pediococcus damnosus]AMV66127.1 hypothetical protein ADU72_0178 [Pediococcus damnosus]AMV68413.1 hypothetical protein ADU73_0001 [Pediococcus damnosus]